MAHWSDVYVNHITIEIAYSDGSRQWWGYDCSQYPTMATAKSDMAHDFRDGVPHDATLMVFALHDGTTASLDIVVRGLSGADFSEYIFSEVGEALWQPAGLS